MKIRIELISNDYLPAVASFDNDCNEVPFYKENKENKQIKLCFRRAYIGLGDIKTVTTPVEACVPLSSDRGSTPLASTLKNPTA
ncbi:hypothetical protein [Paenibacillus beijingensis]|uniref:hypothetical protein n=1 Tax=Paenibacillus beijingensis TaxID=1126833 RepID=UPI0011DD42C5|nr:hypothetical protein [Paenibacillus beijingensis]